VAKLMKECQSSVMIGICGNELIFNCLARCKFFKIVRTKIELVGQRTRLLLYANVILPMITYTIIRENGSINTLAFRE
jgi:hypothetical protein